jgi:hypothetical protein
MMKAGKLFLCVAMLFVVIGMVMGIHGAVFAQDSKLIKIHGVGEKALTGITLEPKTVNIKKNTIVVWLSGVEQQDIKIEFADGKKCKSVTAHASNFDLDTARWCYVTSLVPFAATSTLQFVDVGKYDYKVVSKDGKVSASGQLIVK